MARTTEIPQINAMRCTGCGRCIAVCHLPLIAFETLQWKKFAVLQDAVSCTGCGKCEKHCPVKAITMIPRCIEK